MCAQHPPSSPAGACAPLPGHISRGSLPRSLSPPVGSTEASESHHIQPHRYRVKEEWVLEKWRLPENWCLQLHPFLFFPLHGAMEGWWTPLPGTQCGGRLTLPTMKIQLFIFRFGYINPINYNDNEVFCGGVSHQFGKNGGRYFVFLTWLISDRILVALTDQN